MTTVSLEFLLDGIAAGRIVPYLGPGALAGAKHAGTGAPIPADSDSLILAMNGGKPMAAKLMYEFPRAAMNLELKRGRRFVNDFLSKLYSADHWTTAVLHRWLSEIKPAYVIDCNRDTQLQDGYSDTPHTLVLGIARMGGTEFRYKLYEFDGAAYRAIDNETVNPRLPILFKPLGTPRPEANFIASDADYVDYITELMGGFAIPGFLKDYRKDKQYLLLGLRLTRDTERMILSDVTFGGPAQRGWALIPQATDKERRFCERIGFEVIEASVEDLLDVALDDACVVMVDDM